MTNAQWVILLLGLWVSVPWIAVLHQVVSIVMALWSADEIKTVDQHMLKALDIALEDYPNLNEGIR